MATYNQTDSPIELATSSHEALDVSPLFTSFRVKNVELPNRFVMPAMQRMWCENGRPLPRLADYYRSRVEGGVGLLITESCAIDHPSSTQMPAFAWITEATMDGWGVCVEAVKSAGGRMLMQLWHEGALRKEGGEGPYSQYTSVSPSGLAHASQANGRAATEEDLHTLRDAFVRSAQMAQQLGLDGVELHAAHGFLLDQFLWTETNRRTDGYGGDDMARRVRFPAEIVGAIRGAVGPDFIIALRFSQWKPANYDAKIARTPEELGTMVRVMRQAGVDLFDVSARRFWEPAWPDSPLCLAGWTKSFTDAPVIAVGSVGLDTDVMDSFHGKEAKSTGESGMRELLRRFNNHEFDLVSVGRSHIGDADWVRKVREGRLRDIRPFTKHDLLGDLKIEEPVG